MIQLIVVVLLVVAFSCTLQWKLRKPASTAHTPIKKGYIMLALVIVVLLLSGRLNWVVPLVGGLLAGVFRLFPYLLRYSPFLQQLWHYNKDSKTGSSEQSNSQGRMDREEALEILGLELGATKGDIVAAHRRLIQKFHPDRGGSHYLASRINQAKDILLAA